MAVQIKSIETTESTNLMAVTQPNIVTMNGHMKEVEQIRIEDPNSIERVMEDLSSLNKEESKKRVKLQVAMVVLAAVSVFSILLTVLAPPLGGGMFGFMLGLAISSVLGLAFVSGGLGSHDAYCERTETDQKIKKLIACQQDLQKEDFRSFVKSFGESVSVSKLLEAHSLYCEQKALEQNISTLRQRIQCFTKA
jgi:hypothetical protein